MHIYLDQHYAKLLEQLAFEEGILDVSDVVLPGASVGTENRIGENKLFDLILLSSTFDAPRGLVNWSKFEEYGLAQRNSDDHTIVEVSDAELAEIDKFAKVILDSNVDNMVKYFSKQPGIGPADSSSVAQLSNERWAQVAKEVLEARFGRNLDSIEMLNHLSWPTDDSGKPILLTPFAWAVHDSAVYLTTGLKHSIENCNIFLTIFSTDSVVNPQPVGNEIADLVRIDFRDMLNSFPRARSLKEAFELRSERNVVRLRNQIAHWITSYERREYDVLIRLERDIQKASEEMQFVRNVQEFKNSDFFFWVTSGVSFVPILSNIVTGVSMTERLITRSKEHRFGWVG